MNRRSTGMIGTLLGAFAMMIAVLHPAWWTIRPMSRDADVALDLRGSELESIGIGNYHRLDDDHRCGASGRVAVALVAIALCLAVALAGYHRRVPFLLAALSGISAAAFALMALILQTDFPEGAKPHYTAGAGLLFAVLGGLLGAAGSIALASWSWTPEARGVTH